MLTRKARKVVTLTAGGRGLVGYDAGVRAVGHAILQKDFALGNQTESEINSRSSSGRDRIFFYIFPPTCFSFSLPLSYFSRSPFASFLFGAGQA